MSKFDYEFLPNLDLMIARVRGPVQPREFLAFLADVVGPQPAKNIIWVFSAGAFQFFSIEDLKAIPRTREREWEKRRGGHAFLVAQDPSEKVLIRWFDAIRAAAADQPFTIHQCDSEAEALAKLEAIRESSAN